MESPWYSLMTNVAVVAFFVSVWTQLRDIFEHFGPRAVQAAFGVLMGVGAIVNMLFPVHFAPGVFFDLRTCLLVLAAFFGGPIAALIAAGLAIAYRLWVGGAGAPSGVLAVVLVIIVGTLGHLWLRWRGQRTARWHSIALALATCAVGLLGAALINANVGYGSWTLLFFSVLLSGLALGHDEELRAARRENQIYREVLDTLPDSISVRDLGGRFLAANPATASLFGAPRPAAMIGRLPDAFRTATPPLTSDPDVAAPPPAGPNEFQQALRLPDGTTTWLQTLEVPLVDHQGRRIGVITHNRDITTQKRLEIELDERQRVLSFAMAQMSDGVAMYDHTGRLLFCNARYQQLFPLTSDVRVPGALFRDILATAVARHEQQVGVTPAETSAWIDRIAASLYRDTEEEIHLFNGTWLRVSTRPSPDGVSMAVVSDITSLKRTELELLSVAEQLRQEATTDALTGLVNRRALDQRIEIEIARSLRTGSALSVILLDIDHFKAYNDTYGHLAGDACLKAVSQGLGQVFRRPSDLVARFGGEEFLVMLPEVDAESAYHLANQYRGVLKDMALPHRASRIGHVTVSLGIASYAPGETERSAADLVGRADEALYAAKTAGRDRVSGWRRRLGVVSRRLRVV
ncbi:MAG: diguanylate cyclase [Devosia sp.]|uniref:sensor domain-containing diguanylate cyclase n=1 Tax=Devosia sp. TaxID=1871048 RepID=UPI002609ADD3|nr:diguanylate cyclase [Devosia sp.]MDB5538747.1 diguanylate cyclase [Devosia sp.]